MIDRAQSRQNDESCMCPKFFQVLKPYASLASKPYKTRGCSLPKKTRGSYSFLGGTVHDCFYPVNGLWIFGLVFQRKIFHKFHRAFIPPEYNEL